MIVLIKPTIAIIKISNIFIIFTQEKSSQTNKYTTNVTKKIEENDNQLKISFGVLYFNAFFQRIKEDELKNVDIIAANIYYLNIPFKKNKIFLQTDNSSLWYFFSSISSKLSFISIWVSWILISFLSNIAI